MSKIVGEPVVNVRKLKVTRPVRIQGAGKDLKKQSSDMVRALGADSVEGDY